MHFPFNNLFKIKISQFLESNGLSSNGLNDGCENPKSLKLNFWIAVCDQLEDVVIVDWQLAQW